MKKYTIKINKEVHRALGFASSNLILKYINNRDENGIAYPEGASASAQDGNTIVTIIVTETVDGIEVA